MQFWLKKKDRMHYQVKFEIVRYMQYSLYSTLPPLIVLL